MLSFFISDFPSMTPLQRLAAGCAWLHSCTLRVTRMLRKQVIVVSFPPLVYAVLTCPYHSRLSFTNLNRTIGAETCIRSTRSPPCSHRLATRNAHTAHPFIIHVAAHLNPCQWYRHFPPIASIQYYYHYPYSASSLRLQQFPCLLNNVLFLTDGGLNVDASAPFNL